MNLRMDFFHPPTVNVRFSDLVELLLSPCCLSKYCSSPILYERTPFDLLSSSSEDPSSPPSISSLLSNPSFSVPWLLLKGRKANYWFPSFFPPPSSMLAHLTPQLSRKLSPPLHKQHSEGCYYYAWEGWHKVWWILTTQISNKHLNIDLFRYNLSQILSPKFPSSL